MAHDNHLDELGNWIGTQEDLGHEVPDSADVFPGSLTADDQETAMRGSIAVGDVTRIKDQSDSVEGLRDAPESDDNKSDVPVTAAGDKVTADGKKAKSDEDAAPLAASTTSETPAAKVKAAPRSKAVDK